MSVKGNNYFNNTPRPTEPPKGQGNTMDKIIAKINGGIINGF